MKTLISDTGILLRKRVIDVLAMRRFGRETQCNYIHFFGRFAMCRSPTRGLSLRS